MSDFLLFFDQIVKDYPMHLEISYNKTCDWEIFVWKRGEEVVEIVQVQDCDMQLAFAKAQVQLKEWFSIHNGGY